MLKNTASNLTAQKLRLLLIASIVLLLVLATILFIFTRGVISGYAIDVKKATNSAESSSDNLATLNQLKTTLSENSDAVERTKELVAESRSYAYQDQIIKDLNTFAKKSGVSISGYQFNSSNTATKTSASAGANTGTAAVPAVNGLKSVSVSVNLKSPMEYKDIMDFVHMIEQSLTKMQLAGISMGRDATSGKVTVSSLTVEVYVR